MRSSLKKNDALLARGSKGIPVPFWQFFHGTFEPVHEIQKYFWPKDLLGIMKIPYTKNIHNLFQSPPNLGFRSVKVQTETFLKKDSQDFKNSFQSGFQ